MNNRNDLPFRGVLTPEIGSLKQHWGWLLALGIMFLILGFIGLGMEVFLTIASVMFFGMLLLIGGGFQLAHCIMYCRGWKGVLNHALVAVLYVLTGVIMVNDPLAASAMLTMFIGISLLMVGILRVVTAIQHRASASWVWSLLSGLAGILIGMMIMSLWPVSGLWIIGMFIAIELIIAGWAYIIFALSVKKMADAIT